MHVVFSRTGTFDRTAMHSRYYVILLCPVEIEIIFCGCSVRFTQLRLCTQLDCGLWVSVAQNWIVDRTCQPVLPSFKCSDGKCQNFYLLFSVILKGALLASWCLDRRYTDINIMCLIYNKRERGNVISGLSSPNSGLLYYRRVGEVLLADYLTPLNSP